MWPFFNPPTEVVTFRLHGWCMLHVFLLQAFTRLGHECQDLLSLDLGLYSHPKEFLGNGVRTHVNSKKKIPSTGKSSSEEDQTHDAASHRSASTTHYRLSHSSPFCTQKMLCVHFEKPYKMSTPGHKMVPSFRKWPIIMPFACFVVAASHNGAARQPRIPFQNVCYQPSSVSLCEFTMHPR